MLSIIIVNYNTHDHVENCLNSIYQYCEASFEVIVVDNNSPKRDIINLESKFPKAKFVYLDSNEGFGKGCNEGVKNSTGEVILFLNPDIIVKPGSIEKLLQTTQDDDLIGVVSGSLISQDGDYQYSYNNFPGLSWEFKEAFGISLMKTINKMNEFTKAMAEKNSSFEVDWFHGACMMMRRKVFERVGGFDERIFLYYEDVDLCKKIKDAGFKNVCIPESKFIHHERGSVRDEKGQVVYHFYMHNSKHYYYSKHKSNLNILILRILFITGSVFKMLILPFRKKFRNEMNSRFTGYKTALLVHLNIYTKLPL